MILVGHQRYFGHVRKDSCHLADDADLVDHRLANLYPRDVTLVDDKLLRKRVSPGIEHVGRRGGLREPRRHLQQGPQPRILLLEQGEALRCASLRQQSLPHRGIITGQRLLRGEIRTQVSQRFTGKLHHALQRI